MQKRVGAGGPGRLAASASTASISISLEAFRPVSCFEDWLGNSRNPRDSRRS